MQSLQFLYDPDWDAFKCSGYSERCCPHGYDVNDAYDLHHHHYSHISVRPRSPTAAGGGPAYIPFDYQP